MEFRILGPVELWSAGERRELTAGKPCAVLAVLLLTPGTFVPAEVLIDRLWADPPVKARENLSIYVTRLRASLRQATGDMPLDPLTASLLSLTDSAKAIGDFDEDPDDDDDLVRQVAPPEDETDLAEPGEIEVPDNEFGRFTFGRAARTESRSGRGPAGAGRPDRGLARSRPGGG